MKINEIIVESQVDELSLGGIGKGIGKAIGGITGAWDQAKAGYQSGKKSAYDWARGRSQDDTTSATTSTGQTTVAPGATTTATTLAAAPATSPATSTTAPTTPPAAGTTPAASTASPSAPGAASATASAASSTAAAPAPAANKSQLAADPYNTYKQQMRGQTVPKPGAKPLPQKFVDQINKDLAVFSKGSKDWGVNIADRLVKYGNQGYDVSQLANQWNANAKMVDRMKEGFLFANEYNQLCEMLKAHNVTWGDLGLQIRIVESVAQGVFIGYKKTPTSFDVVFD